MSHEQVALGLERPWFPAWALAQPVAHTRLAAVVRGTGLPILRAVEDRLRPRLGFVARMLGRAPLAVLVAVLGHPFGSQLKACTPPAPPSTHPPRPLCLRLSRAGSAGRRQGRQCAAE